MFNWFYDIEELSNAIADCDDTNCSSVSKEGEDSSKKLIAGCDDSFTPDIILKFKNNETFSSNFSEDESFELYSSKDNVFGRTTKQHSRLLGEIAAKVEFSNAIENAIANSSASKEEDSSKNLIAGCDIFTPDISISKKEGNYSTNSVDVTADYDEKEGDLSKESIDLIVECDDINAGVSNKEENSCIDLTVDSIHNHAETILPSTDLDTKLAPPGLKLVKNNCYF